MAQKLPSKSEMMQELVMLDRVTSALNTAIVALMYVCKVKGNELDKVDPDEYVEFVQKHVHPLVLKADEINKAVASKAKKDLDKELDKAEKEEK